LTKLFPEGSRRNSRIWGIESKEENNEKKKESDRESS